MSRLNAKCTRRWLTVVDNRSISKLKVTAASVHDLRGTECFPPCTSHLLHKAEFSRRCGRAAQRKSSELLIRETTQCAGCPLRSRTSSISREERFISTHSWGLQNRWEVNGQSAGQENTREVLFMCWLYIASIWKGSRLQTHCWKLGQPFFFLAATKENVVPILLSTGINLHLSNPWLQNATQRIGLVRP